MTRRALVMSSRRFGRRFVLHDVKRANERWMPRLSDDARLFVTTFLGGFLFVSLLIA